MLPDNSIFVPTVSHSGTWFLLKFLLSHDDVPMMYEMRNYPGGLVPNNTLIHVHFYFDQQAEKCWESRRIIEVSKKVRTVSSVRDPLLSVITRKERNPEWNGLDIIDSFTRLKELDARFLCVDLPVGREKREVMLTGILDHLGLQHQPQVPGWALGWPVFNTRHSYELKTMYHNKDASGLKSKIPLEWDYILSKRDEIVPFMKSLGYEYLWWWEC
jgi:hypothetical protein